MNRSKRRKGCVSQPRNAQALKRGDNSFRRPQRGGRYQTQKGGVSRVKEV